MIEVVEHITYPFEVRCWPPKAFAKRSDMQAWLDKNVKWDGNLNIIQAEAKNGGKAECRPNLAYNFRVHSLEDVALLKMRC